MVTGIAELNEKKAKVIAKEADSLDSIKQKSVRVIEFELDGKKVPDNKFGLKVTQGGQCVTFNMAGMGSLKFCMNRDRTTFSGTANYKNQSTNQWITSSLTGKRIR